VAKWQLNGCVHSFGHPQARLSLDLDQPTGVRPIIKLDYVESDSAAHMDASIRMIERADELVAIWDGQPARGYGGTADVVHAAHDRQVPVIVVWPDGAERR